MTLAPTRRVRRGGRLLLVLAGAVLTLGVGAAPAAAHNVLIGSSPAPDAQVGATPGEIVLTFDQPAVAMGTQMIVTGPSGPVQTGPPRLVDDTVSQPVAGGAPPGAYTVAWRVTSADGHPVTGTFAFTSTSPGAGSGAAASTPAGPAVVDHGSSVGAVVLVAALVLVVGVVAVVLVRRRRATGSPGS